MRARLRQTEKRREKDGAEQKRATNRIITHSRSPARGNGGEKKGKEKRPIQGISRRRKEGELLKGRSSRKD